MEMKNSRGQSPQRGDDAPKFNRLLLPQLVADAYIQVTILYFPSCCVKICCRV